MVDVECVKTKFFAPVVKGNWKGIIYGSRAVRNCSWNFSAR